MGGWVPGWVRRERRPHVLLDALRPLAPLRGFLLQPRTTASDQATLGRALGNLVERLRPGAINGVRAFGRVVLEPISEAEIAGGLVEFEHALRHRWRDRATEARERPASLGRKS